MPSERVLVTGATGMIGSAVVARLLADDCIVRAYVHAESAAKLPKHPHVEIAIGDMRDGVALTTAMHEVDWVVHLAACKSDESESEAVNVGGAENLVAACKAHPVRRILNISTQSVKLSHKGRYASTKAKADAIFATSGLPVTTLLPSVVYGKVDQGIFGSLLKFLKLPVVPIIGSGKATFRPIHQDDFARALPILARDPASVGRVFDVGGPDEVSFNWLVDELLHRKGMRKMRMHIPSSVALCIATCISWMRRPPVTRSNVLGADAVLEMNVDPFFAAIGFVPRSLRQGLDDLFGPTPHDDSEPRALLQYVMPNHAEPDAAMIALYRHACEIHEINPLHRLEHRVVENRWMLGGLDAVTRLLRPQCTLQRKLLVAAAIVECSPASANALLPRNRSKVALFCLVLGAGLSAISKLLLGALLCCLPHFYSRNAGL